MSRRRKKNTLLPKMVGLAVVVNAVLLPLLAHFGAFKAIHGQRLTPVRLVSLPPPPKRPPPPKHAPPKKRTAKAKPRPQAHVSARPATAHVSRPNPNQPKVVAAAPGGAGSGPTIDNSGTRCAGPGACRHAARRTGPWDCRSAPARAGPAACSGPAPTGSCPARPRAPAGRGRRRADFAAPARDPRRPEL